MLDISTKKVALFIETSTSYGRSLIRGIVQYANIATKWFFYNEPRGLQDTIPDLVNWKLDGIIMRDTDNNMALLKLNIPTIVSVRYRDKIDGLTSIIGNSLAIGKTAADYFKNKGFKYFAYCGFHAMPWSREREEAFFNALSPGENSYLYHNPGTNIDYDQDVRHIASWLKKLPIPSALLACNDVRAAHVLEACKIADIRVPQQIAVLGVNNDDMICNLTSPPLSSISLNTVKAGYEAAKTLDTLMSSPSHNDNKDIVVEPQGVLSRQSTDVFAINDPDMAQALYYITNRARHPIQVNDVVSYVGSNRRTLERKFQRTINKSIYEAIKHTRINLMSNMLLETDLSITAIAHNMGFQNHHHISRYFKSARGISPLKFRNLNCV